MKSIFKWWFYIPALIFLLLTLLSGTWLRLQWGWPLWELSGFQLPESLNFRADYLTHGHSHVALLGWVFLGLMGLVFEGGSRTSRLPVASIKLLTTITIIVTVALFGAFTRQGYAPLSIALSTVHMLLGYAFALLFFLHARKDSNIPARHFLEGAVFWMLVATAGPWLLAFGRELPSFWMDAAVQYYLHVLFNGCFLFALAGLSYRFLVIPKFQQQTWPFWLMFAGLLPALIPSLPPETLFYLDAEAINLRPFTFLADNAYQTLPAVVATATGIFPYTAGAETVWNYALLIAGMAGTVSFATGGLAVFYVTIRSIHKKRKNLVCRPLLLTGLIATVPVLLLPVPMSWPLVRNIWLQSDFLVIGFIHLHLLVMVSSLLLFGIMQRISTGWSVGLPGKNPLRNNISRKNRQIAGSTLFLVGSIAMTLILIMTGCFQILGIIVLFPIQKTLFYSGLTALAGAILLISDIRK